jgi:hypothetical protein
MSSDDWYMSSHGFVIPKKVIQRAVKILGIPDAREDVIYAIEHVFFCRDFAVRRTKKGKSSARRLAKALRRVDVAMRNPDLFPPLRRYLDHQNLLRWINECETTAESSSKFETDGERDAAKMAHELMLMYGQPISTTKGSKFEQLAATLAGRPGDSFHHHCRDFMRRNFPPAAIHQ